MGKKTQFSSVKPIDCACVIYGNGYTWDYVEKLYNMLERHISPDVRFHVYTEDSRAVPSPMIKHVLDDLKITNPKKLWWYKMQLFNTKHHSGPLLYFDLDTVIVKNIDWIWTQPTDYFWGIKDFKYLWRNSHQGINSSVMWWDTTKFEHVWANFAAQDTQRLITKYHGDQDFISEQISQKQRRFLDQTRIKSWRWQALDGGYDFSRRKYLEPDSGTNIVDNTSVLVFHGNPKPAQITDPVVQHHWR